MALLDVNPMGKVRDLYGKGSNVLMVRDMIDSMGDVSLVTSTLNHVKLLIGEVEVDLEVDEVMGGNQWNVLQNLSFFKNHYFSQLNVQAHFGLGSEEAVGRTGLYLPERPKIDLVSPENSGHILFDENPSSDETIMISSSPFGESGQDYWTSLKRYLSENTATRFYWNPGTKQIYTTLDLEALELLRGRCSIFQLSAAEAEIFMRRYGNGKGVKDLPEFIGAKWTVITEGAAGIRLYAEGEPYHAPIPSEDYARNNLGGRYVEGQDVGCGDIVLATLIALREATPELPIESALKLATKMGSIQFHQKGSNLSSLQGVALSL